MFSTLLLAGAMLAQAPPGEAPPPPAAQAVELARRGEYREALDAFRRIVAAAPGDHDARVWIARLHGWMGDAAAAEAAYRSVLHENDGHVDAMVGLGGTLVALGRRAEAIEVLTPAERRAPDSPDVLAALARAYRAVARTSLALQYIERAVFIAPTAENRLTREQILQAHAHRFETTGLIEQFSAALPDARSADVAVSVRLRDRVRVVGRGQFQDKFDARETRAGIGLEWRWQPQTLLTASLIAGPGNVVLPQVDVNLEAAHARGRAEWTAGYRFIEFSTAEVSVFSPGVTLSPRDTVLVGARYYLALAQFAGLDSRQASHSTAVRVSVQTFARAWLSAGYSRGTEDFETLSPDRIGQFRADTVSGGARLDLPSLTSLFAGYEYQWRTRGTNMGRVTLALIQRF